MKLYFAYGANLNIASMSNRCPDAVAVQSFYLSDWNLEFSGVATIKPKPGGFVAGALWAISEEDERALDQFEGWPTLYRKEVIQSDGLEFMVYIMNSSDPAEPSVNYAMTIAQGYQDWDLDLEDLVAAIERTQEATYDLYAINSNNTYYFANDRDLVHDISLESGNDLRRIGDHGLAYPDSETFQ